MTRNIHSEAIDHQFAIGDRPARIVSLLPSATEALYHMGLIDRVIGVSEYCDRYVPDLTVPQVGQYLNCDIEQIKNLEPDLVLTTGGIQRKLALKLAKENLPVFVLPLPQSFHGILENIRILGGLMNELEASRKLTASLSSRADVIRQAAPTNRPKVYLELWLGRHMRAVGGGSYIEDLITIAGGDLIFKNESTGYFTPDFEQVSSLEPDIHLFFHEPEYLVDPTKLVADRNWNPDTKIIISTVKCGENMIQDGPSFLDTAEWLQQQLIL
ncbi:iron ABC transporter substrate-binding protein [Oceaniferula spumae]|uniref:Iron ABC transporter substrate-binding protein n=1 Tax=Oceaniferula spumae TaxID=2979115 RepID=A0AAT9FQ23_9BACT